MYAQLKTGLLHVDVALDCSEICINLKYLSCQEHPSSQVPLFLLVQCSQPYNLAKLCATSDKTIAIKIIFPGQLLTSIASTVYFRLPFWTIIIALLDHMIPLGNLHMFYFEEMEFCSGQLLCKKTVSQSTNIQYSKLTLIVVFNHVS